MVTTVEKDEGSFDAVKIELADKTGGIGGGAMINLTVTEPHGMIVVAGNGGEQQIIKANLVDVGHKMLGQEGRIHEVVKIEPIKIEPIKQDRTDKDRTDKIEVQDRTDKVQDGQDRTEQSTRL